MTTESTVASAGPPKLDWCYRCGRPQHKSDMRAIRTASGGRVRRCVECASGNAPVNKPGALGARSKR